MRGKPGSIGAVHFYRPGSESPCTTCLRGQVSECTDLNLICDAYRQYETLKSRKKWETASREPRERTVREMEGSAK